MKKISVWGRSLQPLFQFSQHAGLPLWFMLLLFLPLADTVLHISPPIAIKEKRTLAAKPQFDLQRPWEYLVKFEAYFNDHFGFRSQLVQTHNLLTYWLFRTSPLPKVIVGRQGWLFLSRG